MKGIGQLQGIQTAGEILQQPRMWRDTVSRIIAHSDTWRTWLTGAVRSVGTQVLLSGAGTSYYAALAMQPFWRKTFQCLCEAWPTTRVLVEPESVIGRNRNVFLVSLARSGNNPETIGTVRLVEKLASETHHLAITCNADSFLGKLGSSDITRVLCLHPATKDIGLAMTSSFTSLIVAGQAMAGLLNPSFDPGIIEDMAVLAEELLARSTQIMRITQENDFDRVVILGDGSLYAIALEGVLKFEEFSDGHILGIGETFLAARHGYANVINDRTLVVFLLASNPYVRAYQIRVVRELHERRPRTTRVAVSLHYDPVIRALVDDMIVLDELGDFGIPDMLRAPLDAIVVQCLSFQSALKLGVPPDSPFRHRATAKAIDGCELRPHHLGCGIQ